MSMWKICWEALVDIVHAIFPRPTYEVPIENNSMNSPDPSQPPIVIAPLPTEAVVPMNPPASHPQSAKLLDAMCIAIRDYEGSPGDRNYRNCNPGNTRYSSVGYLPIYRPVGRDPQNFAIFKDMETGMLYLHNLIKYKVSKNPTQTLLQFMENYAPTSDGNDPAKYATFIARRLSVTPAALMQYIV